MANKSKWMVSAKKADFNLIAGECGISPILARLIRNRDVVGVEETRRFLKGTTRDLHDPRMLPDAEKAVDILCQKIEEGGKIRIIGDYDVDGRRSPVMRQRTRCFRRDSGTDTVLMRGSSAKRMRTGRN